MVDFVIILVTGWFGFVKSQFLVPTEQSPIEEIFAYDEYYEYVFSNQALEWDLAASICRYEYEGTLATLETDDLKQFAIEAMSESNMALDGLWLGLQRINGIFRWLDVNITVPDEEFTRCGNNANISYNCSFGCTNEIDCGALVRANHTEFCLVNLSCEADRGFICKRPTGDPSTHTGWIRIRHRLYKIFYKRLSHDEASKACIRFDKAARLAVVETYEDAELLGRHLLIGRPSLERAWMGARWEEDFMQYAFEWESILLTNTTDPSGYPPWRRHAMSKPLGCLLLDRHLSNITYFVESACDRLHYYICYKLIDEGPINICNESDYDWRIYYNKKDWFQATAVCEKSAPSGRLPVLERKDMKYFIHIMESSKLYLLHVWLGAYFSDGIWTWTYTNRSLPKFEENGYPPWVVNRSYEDSVEFFNLCLNIDRENALAPLFYGTRCNYAQTFLCQYDKGTICHNGTSNTSTTSSFSTSRGTRTTPITTTRLTKTTTLTTRTTAKSPTTRTRTTTITKTTPTIKTTPTTKTSTTKTTSTTPKTTKTTKLTTRSTRSTTKRPTRPPKTTSTRTPKTTSRHKTRPSTTRSTRKVPTTTTTKRTKHTTKTRHTGKYPTTEGPLVVSTTTEWSELKRKRLFVTFVPYTELNN